MTNDPTVQKQDLDDISQNNAVVQRMVRDKLPFTRETYIELVYGDNVPKPWTHANEKFLPPVFQDPNIERVHEALQGLGDAIGITYTGTIPK